MPGGNWYQYQPLNNGKVEWPAGPTGDFDKALTPRWVQAWVVQGGADDGAGTTTPGQSIRARAPVKAAAESSWSGWDTAASLECSPSPGG